MKYNCYMNMEKIDQYELAIAYVPWQKFKRIYPIEKGFRIGTIFPELNKPFLKERCDMK